MEFLYREIDKSIAAVRLSPYDSNFKIRPVWTFTDDENLKIKIMYQRSLLITRCLTLYYLSYMLFWEISVVYQNPLYI